VYNGFNAALVAWQVGNLGSTVGKTNEWTPEEAGNTLLAEADTFKFTMEFVNGTSLGANDPARRVAISTALQAAINSNTDIRSEIYEYNLILCPGFPEVVDEMINLCVDINEEAFVIADTPFNVDPDAVVGWAGGLSTPNVSPMALRQTNRNVAYYYPHGLASNLDGTNVFCAASGVALRTITYSDNVSELWFAPAGTRRGMVTGTTMVGYVTGTLGTPTTFVETALNQGQRDNMYKYFTNLNPIVFFPGRGLIVWGQKTSAPDASALDRINVVRLMMYIKRQLRKNTMSFVFEPNDKLTRDNLKSVVDSFLGDLIVKRGLYDFVTVCDESNNTPDRIDRNELYVDVALKPVKAAEFIYIPIRVVNTGASI
jgi:phage tail sheath protein FI